MGKLNRLVSSGASALLINLVSMAIKFGTNLVLAWFLLPEMFGVAAIVTSIVTGMVLLSDVGINDSIIRHEHGDRRAFCATAWMIQAGRGVMLYLILAVAAPWIAAFYDLPALRDYLWVAGLALPIQGLKSVWLVVLQRRMTPLPELKVELAAQATAAVWMLALVSQWPSVWVLVSAHVVVALVEVAGSHLLTPRGFRAFRIDRHYLKEILNFGKWIYIGTIATFLLLNLDKLLLGKIETFSSLGVYQVASAFSMISYSLALSLLTRLIYPALAESARDDHTAMAESIRQLKHIIFPTITAMQLLVFLVAPWFFSLLYPESFSDATWMAQMLAVLAWITLASDFQGTVLIAWNRPKLFAIVLLGIALTRPLMALTGYYIAGGMAGFIAGMVVGAIGGFFAYRRLLHRELGSTGNYELYLGGVAAATIAIDLALNHSIRGAGLPPVALNLLIGATICLAFLWSIRRTMASGRTVTAQ